MTEETLFHEALSRQAEERAVFLAQACTGRPELRAAVEALLAAHDKPSSILNRPPADLGHRRSQLGQPGHGAAGGTRLNPTTRPFTTSPPPTIAPTPSLAPSSPAVTPWSRSSAKAAWARSGSPSRPNR